MARDSQGIPQKKMKLSSMHGAMTAHRPSTPSASSKMGGKDDMPPKEMGGAESGGHYQIHPHEDGSAHTVTPSGEEMQHPSIHHAATHMLGHHGPGEKHMVIHHNGVSMTSHHTHGDGKVNGPDEHPDMESLKSHIEQAMGENEGPSEGMHDDAEPAMSGTPMY